MHKLVAVLATLAALAAVNLNIHGRERLLAEGRVVLLELAPVDPRSLMQGDYMALRFRIANEAFGRDRLGAAKDGHIVAKVDGRGVASFARFADAAVPLAAGEVLLRYRIRDRQPKFATNAFFFQEGHADRYQHARYGEFRVAPDGDMILTALRDADFTLLGRADAPDGAGGSGGQ
ncbi:MAG TPA: GDYXXLXY domain-containing protein [Paucimonas sp.]|nr:GDYXXLXY domain-containing protein [Paucimonas sp.]